jgi:predicted MPP superfamily phosphohydrolase
MNRLLSPFVLALTAILGAGYAYAAWRLTAPGWARIALALPFLLVWLVPVVYWVYGRDNHRRADDLLHAASYVSMGWLTYVLVLGLLRDALLLLGALAGGPLEAAVERGGVAAVWGGSIVALAAGMLAAVRGPHVRRVEVAIDRLPAAFEGFTIAQISDLHVGPTIGAPYVRRVVDIGNALEPDLIALTGDIVDGSVTRLAAAVAPLAQLRARDGVVLALGNHDYYSGANAWAAHFRSLGIEVLRNEFRVIERGGAQLIDGGVTDPAGQLEAPPEVPRPELAAGPPQLDAPRILLAHNPKLAPLAERAGFDLQLSGHTHAGQFFPWTLAVRLVHAPHVEGLSRQGRTWVYVNAGTGTWGPPVRLGTRPELTLLRLTAAARRRGEHAVE